MRSYITPTILHVVCKGEPEVANGTTNWSSDEVWPDGSHVQGTCNEGLYLHPSVDNQQEIVCTFNGWQDAAPCEEGVMKSYSISIISHLFCSD